MGTGTSRFHQQRPYFRRYHEINTMKTRAFLSIAFATVATAAVLTTSLWGEGQSSIKKPPQNRFIPRGRAAPEGPAKFFSMPGGKTAVNGDNPSSREAVTGFDDLTNGYFEQGPDFDTITEDNVQPLRSYNDGRFIFEEKETAEDGLGPTYNTQSCSACHQNIVTGAASQIAEHRTGHTFNGQFFESPGGSLIQSRATFPEIVEHVLPADEVRTFRMSTSTLGEGYAECISDSTLLAIRDAQPS